jgi:glutamate-1-semialdehyde 2,1-aminomutase
VLQLCDRHGVVLIFDEVITGFRVGPGGAQGRLGVLPDLAVYAKALGAGFPIAALAGRQALMERLGDGSTLHGGTYNTNLVSTSAAIAALEELGRDGGAVYGALEARGEALMAGLRQGARAAGVPLLVQGLGAVFNTAFLPQAAGPNGTPSGRPSREAEGASGGAPAPGVSDYRAYAGLDVARQRAFLRALQDGGVRVTARGTWFLSTAHSDADVEQTLRVAERALRAV